MTLERVQSKMALRRDVLEFGKQLATNPILSGLVALGLNQAAYRAGFWDARRSPDGRTYTWKRTWGVDANGIHFGDAVWTATDPEQIAAQNATVIGDAILAAMIAYAAKSPMVQPIIGVKS